MALSENEKNDVRAKVLIELESMFTEMGNKYNTKENHDMMLYLLDIETSLKNSLGSIEESSSTASA